LCEECRRKHEEETQAHAHEGHAAQEDADEAQEGLLMIVERSIAETQLLCWLEDHKPELACSLDYCVTHDDMRKVLNAHTGLEIGPEDDREEAFRRYLKQLAG
jgi:hypothetical protein